MKKVVITGSNGLLGQSLVNLLLEEPQKYQVIGFSKGKNRSGRTDFEYSSIDITDKKNLLKNLEEYQPDVIINTAAMTNVDACETNKTACDLLNIDVVDTLKFFSSANNTHLIHISTDFIFDGKKGFYKETDIPNPVNYYGISKLKAEQILTQSNIDYTILRTVLVYGKVFDMSRSNIVLWVKKSLEDKKEITIVNDQYRMPTYVDDLALACKLALDKKATGIFNISSNTLLSIYEIAQQIAVVFQLDKSLIKPIKTSELQQAATRPSKTGFNLKKTTEVLQFYPKSFQENLQKFKEKLT
ncbi:SDR family oxidoreductase [Tenacibaculum finnmarkense]|uniref:SDR family oxidoreductase n=1 Tax=Tenacibaculum finnmarkense TaxID=2781243 RepID=UPI001EFBC527|nr:SDR family oxidoreductase [Tenacibaculum finnmarkense]MCG8235514.1 SDR family oxidoreductase [Tenacibaculum finnmarkense genomovar ulcerans]MCG8806685.1 SDR family oxidoreductase [Tenacibaculum finnmarkense]MCG8816925.1 SDR family oxidoreductase [Tenacibaculum finnmarkense]MCG8829644.1 SDR family oxidoreductase [Tenacibaculum finnmarkense]